MKKLMSIFVAMIMVFVMAVPAFAATTVTINTPASETGAGKYSAYQLFTVEELGVLDSKMQYKYTVNEKYKTVLINQFSLANTATSDEIVEKVKALTPEQAAIFAKEIYAKIVTASITGEKTNEPSPLTLENGGYYLIVETDKNTSTVYSANMLKTLTGTSYEINSKEDKPIVDKDVSHGSGMADGSSASVGDTLSYQIKGTVSQYYDVYDAYYYKFTDTMSKGLTFNDDIAVYYGGTEDPSTGKYTPGTLIDPSEYTKTVTTDSAGNTVITIEITDLKGIAAVNPGTVWVTYTATVNVDAETGKNNPNTNKAELEFSNNPNGADHGTVTPDDVYVYAFKVVINKVDESGTALTGANFKLYKWDESTSTYGEVEHITDTGISEFTFTGLGEGTYKLEETKVPDGYNKAADIVFTITPTIDTTTGEITGLTSTLPGYAVDLVAGTITAKVENKAGIVLPETGGIGTTIFYVSGAALLFGSVVLFVTKKRMGN